MHNNKWMTIACKALNLICHSLILGFTDYIPLQMSVKDNDLD
jgi:hypothetical protein